MDIKALTYRGVFYMEYERHIRNHMVTYPKADRVSIQAIRRRSIRYHWFTKGI